MALHHHVAGFYAVGRRTRGWPSKSGAVLRWERSCQSSRKTLCGQGGGISTGESSIAVSNSSRLPCLRSCGRHGTNGKPQDERVKELLRGRRKRSCGLSCLKLSQLFLF